MQGDAEGNYTVVALLDDANTDSPVPMSMQAIGFFQQSPTQDLPVWIFQLFCFVGFKKNCFWIDFPVLEREPADPVGGRRNAQGGAAVRIPRRKVRVPARLARHRTARRHRGARSSRRGFPLQVQNLLYFYG